MHAVFAKVAAEIIEQEADHVLIVQADVDTIHLEVMKDGDMTEFWLVSGDTLENVMSRFKQFINRRSINVTFTYLEPL